MQILQLKSWIKTDPESTCYCWHLSVLKFVMHDNCCSLVLLLLFVLRLGLLLLLFIVSLHIFRRGPLFQRAVPSATKVQPPLLHARILSLLKVPRLHSWSGSHTKGHLLCCNTNETIRLICWGSCTLSWLNRAAHKKSWSPNCNVVIQERNENGLFICPEMAKYCTNRSYFLPVISQR